MQLNSTARDRIRHTVGRLIRPTGLVPVHWARRHADSWLAGHFGNLPTRGRPSEIDQVIINRLKVTESHGEQPLWRGYNEPDGSSRSAQSVSTRTEMGRVYRELVIARTPDLVVEFGTAFGASGMWWLSGLEATERGRLLTFDPNDVWRSLAEANLSAVGSRYTAVAGTFEDKVDEHLGQGEQIDLAFIDAIHTSEFVNPQFDLVAERCAPGAVIVLDDIDFSKDMQDCWRGLASHPRVLAALELGRRVGVVELAL